MRAEQRRKLKLGLISTAAGLLLFVLLDFDGDLDFGGHYEILQTVPCSKNKIAFEIYRWDNSPLDGPRFTVIVDDHTPSKFELRRAMISFTREHQRFDLADAQVSIIWTGLNQLSLIADAPNTTPDWLTAQDRRIGNVAVEYSGRP